MKKKIFSLSVACMFAAALVAQNKSFFILQDFMNAKIFFKNNTMTVAPMNYDAGKNRMYFMQNNERMELTNASAIDSIIWDGVGKFITYNNSYLEEIKLTNGIAYIEWKLKEVNLGSRGVLGMPTQAKIDQISLQSMGIYSTKDENVVDVYQQKNDNAYFLKIDDKFNKVRSVKQVIKLFPDHKEDIEEYTKKRKIDMNNTLSVLQLLDYVLSFSK